MEYIFGILVIFLMVFMIQKLLSAKYQPQIKWVWLGLFVILSYNLLAKPYRVERIIADITKLIN